MDVFRWRSALVELGHQFQEMLRYRLLDEIVVHHPQFGRDVPLVPATHRGADLMARSRKQHNLSIRPVPWGQTVRKFAHVGVSGPNRYLGTKANVEFRLEVPGKCTKSHILPQRTDLTLLALERRLPVSIFAGTSLTGREGSTPRLI